jgi:hypothetical protein
MKLIQMTQSPTVQSCKDNNEFLGSNNIGIFLVNFLARSVGFQKTLSNIEMSYFIS